MVKSWIRWRNGLTKTAIRAAATAVITAMTGVSASDQPDWTVIGTMVVSSVILSVAFYLEKQPWPEEDGEKGAQSSE